ncbi:GNAT family N-acetyltransferase [Brevibacillus ginsengisoli]|uniref:GNAT family N-acetyltransferase n=1 Tax=Brevibacillus ginsengisoli TaxID=363854 RepID=UPI003CEA0465
MSSSFDIRIVSTEQERQDALDVRRFVFIEEQEVPEDLEIDEHDESNAPTTHFVAYDREVPVGAGRIRTYTDGVGKVERVAVMKTQRGTGLGAQLMKKIEEEASRQGFSKLKLNAQCHAQRFYEKLGYEPVGEVFDEAGIDHIAMEKTL